MASVNKVILVGNIGQDASLRKMNSGDAVVNLSLATTETWKDRSSGQKKEHTEWHRITFYRKLATLAAQYLKKGAQVYIEGRLQTRKFTPQDGVERHSTEIICTTFQILGGRQPGADERHSDDEDSDD